MKSHNHLYPAFHIRKWVDNGGLIYDKIENQSREVDSQNDFSSVFYYSLGKEDCILEDRIAKFEGRISTIIKKIDKSNDKITLSGKELELLKLYCVLCGSRHEYTCEVIRSDESNYYQSNNYLWGLHRTNNQKDAVKITEMIMDDFDKINVLPNDIESWIKFDYFDPNYIYSHFTTGLHVVILRTDENSLCVSDRFCIIENTMDSDFLYSYVPVSPSTALLLVKTKYYFDVQQYFYTLKRLSRKYGAITPDKYLSSIFYVDDNYNYENLLLCSYSHVKSAVHVEDTDIIRSKASIVTVKIKKMPIEIVRQFNSIFCEDGNKILYCNKNELDVARKTKVPGRDIVMEPIF